MGRPARRLPLTLVPLIVRLIPLVAPASLEPVPLQPGTPFAFGCTGPSDPALLERFTEWLFGELRPNSRATVAWDVASGPGGWNGNGSADVFIKFGTPALFYQHAAPLGPDELAVLRRLDEAGVYNSFQVGEWGNGFHCLGPSEQTGADPGCGRWVHGLSGPCGISRYFNDTMVERLGRNPRNNSEASKYVQEWWEHRQSLVEYGGRGGGTHSTPGFSYYSHEPARWGSKLVGFEVGENIENAQLSPWHGASETSVCADGASGCKNSAGICGGQDAGHSLSFLRRMFIYHWLAGTALNTAECCSCYGFDDGTGRPWKSTGNWSEPHWAAPKGQMLKDIFTQLYAARDRGMSHAPLAIVLDAEAGFGGSVCSPLDRQQWGTFKHSEHTQSVYDLLNEQLLSCEPDCQFPAIDANLSRGETMQLRSSPHGEFYDILQSDVSPELLALYPAVLLAGDIVFERAPGLVAKLMSAATAAGSKLRQVLMQPYHAAAMGAPALAALRASFNGSSNAVELLQDWFNPKLNRTAAISDARLASLSAELNLVNVSAAPFGIQWATNVLANGDVLVYLANNRGVAKPACSAQVLDTTRTTNVTITTTKFAFAAVQDWLGSVAPSQSRPGPPLNATVSRVELGPGEAALLHFSVLDAGRPLV